MSRLIVKNLPKKISESKLQTLFAEKGQVTDVQLKYTPDGKFRQFAFVGYQNEEDATSALNYFNGYCLNLAKISVERCAILGDDSVPKSRSKHSKVNQKSAEVVKSKTNEDKADKDEHKKNNKKKKVVLEKYKDDLDFAEYMKLHGAKDLSLIPSEDAEAEDENKGEDTDASSIEENTEDAQQTEKLALQEISDLEYMKSLKKRQIQTPKQPKPKIDLFMIKLRNLAYRCKKKEIKEFLRPIVPYTIRIPPKIKGFAYVGFKTETQQKQALLKHKSFINGKQIMVMKYNQGSEDGEEATDMRKQRWAKEGEALKHEEDIVESGRIFFRNLSYATTEDDIQKLFEKFGPVVELNVPTDHVTHKLKGFGTVTFLMPEHAVLAYSKLDGTVFHGRMLHLLPGKAKKTENDNEDDSNYKQKKTAKQKAQSGSAHNWNSLFLGHDAVANAIAEAHGASKEDVLVSNNGSSAAVRLALGETHIVATTRKYLEQEGVCLDAFNEVKGPRSKITMLVKNLPSKTSAAELSELFKKHGEVNRIILPPSGITALVEFVDPFDAKKAFTRLAYSKFKNVPLFLEWAPEQSLAPKLHTQPKSEHENNVGHENPIESVKEEAEEEEEPEPDTTLFVKNLHFDTTDEVLRQHFASCGKIHYCTVAKKKDVSNPNNLLSMGYGFVRFMRKDGLEEALKNLQGSTLDEKTLELKRSQRTLQDDLKVSRKTTKTTKQKGSKILVRNIPFQANRNEINDLFKTFGEIKALRLPKKMSSDGGAHRGFAFVEYAFKTDAEKAFEALCQSTHLYGRRLVLEWASAEENVDQIRKRTAGHFHATTEVKSKKSTLDMDNNA